MSHTDVGFRRLLVLPYFYELYQALVGGNALRRTYLHQVVRPTPGMRVLDVGCGTGHILDLLPPSVHYVGIDMNERYIQLARRRYGTRPNVRFVADRVESIRLTPDEPYDIVMANALLHHVDDDAARSMLRQAHDALRVGGAFCSFENAWHPDQSAIARFIISKDRGRSVRTVEGYEKLLREFFPQVESSVSHRSLRIPYTIVTLRAQKA